MNSQLPPPRQAIAAQADTGKTCPYCRFPLKEGSAIVQCGACEATHHADCWNENGGCTVVGCVAGPSADASTKVMPAMPPVAAQRQPMPQSHARRSPLLAISILVLALVVAGVGVAFVITNGNSDATAGPAPQQTSSSDASQQSEAPVDSPPVSDSATDQSDTSTQTSSSGSSARSDVPENDGYVAQLGSFKHYAGAEDLVAQFSSSGIDARIVRSNDIVEFAPGYWVVYAGPFDSKSKADQVARSGNRHGAQGAFARYATVQ